MFKKLLLFLLLTSFSYGQESLPRIPLDTNLEVSGFEPMDKYLANKRIVLFGENHSYVSSNQLLKLKTIQYLYNDGFRYLTMEFGAGIGYLSNQYVKTGDTALLTILNGGFPDNEKNHIHELLLGVERMNRELPVEEKVRIRGIDYTRYPVYSLKALAYILEQKQCQREFYTFYEDIEIISSINLDDDYLGFASRLEPSRENFDIRYGFKSYKNRLFELSIRKLVEDFYEDSVQFKNRLGEEYADFEMIIEELKQTLDWYLGAGVDIQMHIERERHLTRGIRKILDKDSLAKITGQFGRCHTRTVAIDDDCYSFSMSSMVKRLSRDSLLQEQIAVLPIYYKNEGEVRFNRRKTSLNLYDLLPTPGIYIYDFKDSLFSFDKVDADSNYALINTYWNGAYVDEIVAESEDIGDRRVKRRKQNGEELFGVGLTMNYLPSEINSDFDLPIFPSEQYGLMVEMITIESNGVQNKFGVNISQPINAKNDSLSLRYTNWQLQSSLGYNIIYRQNFDFFTNYHFALGFAKIVERRGFAETIYTYSTDELKSVYRNPYFNIAGELGFRLKFGWFGIQAVAGYQYDFTNPKWRYKTILPHSTGVNFRNFYGQAGILLRF